MNLAQAITAYSPQIQEAVKKLNEEGDPGMLIGLAPDLIRLVSELNKEQEDIRKATFIASIAAQLSMSILETCENEADQYEHAHRAVRLASKIVRFSLETVKAEKEKGD